MCKILIGKRVAVAVLLVGLAGCASVGRGPGEAGADRLDVAIVRLAGPTSSGRAPRSFDSRQARKYIESRFEAYGLVPWGEEKGFAQSVRLGTNVIGVLPGSDPVLAKEMVLVCAHYDHIGKGNRGASDDASGVAIMLEIAKRMSENPKQYKRSICFAAFDCEESMLWGSIAFTCRPDFDPKRFAGVINLDMFGHEGFDTMDGSVFLALTHEAPALRAAAESRAAKEGLNLYPVNLAAVAPAGDHASFASVGTPAVMLSNGPFDEYHKKGDTVEALDMSLVGRTTEVAADLVRLAANEERVFGTPMTRAGTPDDCRVVESALRALTKKAGCSAETGADCVKVAEAMGSIKDSEERRHMEFYGLLAESVPLLYPPDSDAVVRTCSHIEPLSAEEQAKVDGQSTVLSLAYSERHMSEVFATYREMAQRVQSEKGLPREDFRLEKAFKPGDDEFVLSQEGDTWTMTLLLPALALHYERWGRVLPLPNAYVTFMWAAHECRGSRDDLVDYCLREWGWKRDNPEYVSVWRGVLGRVAPEYGAIEKFEAARDKRMKELGVANEAQWELAVLTRRNPDLLRQCEVLNWLGLLGEKKYVETMRGVIMDKGVPASLRARFVEFYLMWSPEKKSAWLDAGMLADLGELAGDTAAVEVEASEESMLRGLSGPLAVMLRKAAMNSARHWKPEKTTIGQLAQRRLREFAGGEGPEDDAAYWRNWAQTKAAALGDGKLFGPRRLSLANEGYIEFGASRKHRGHADVSVRMVLPGYLERPWSLGFEVL